MPYLIFLFLSLVSNVFAQTTSVQHDSLTHRLGVLRQLVADQNFERAQVEAEDFRWFLRRERLITPAEAVELISNIYAQNRDEKSAGNFLAEVERDARRHRNYQEKARLLGALIAAYENWKMPEKALAAQRQLVVTQDSIASQQVNQTALRWRRQLDSLASLRQLEQSQRSQFFEIEKEVAIGIASGVAILILALLLLYILSSHRWRKKLAEKVEENEFLRSERYQNNPQTTPEQPKTLSTTALSTTSTTTSMPQEFVPPRPGEVWVSPMKTALVIEPNRKVVIYLKTLLSDEFEVHTTHTPYEGLQMAAELLPDLIVCDSILNGKTGTEVIREIKFDARTNHIPVVMLTGKWGDEAKLDALGAGADLFFPRPLLDSELNAQVKLLFGVQKTQHQEFSRALHLYFTDHRVIPNEPFLQKTMFFIESELHDPNFTPEILSQKMQLTKFHFQKKLFALTGREAAQLIREMRMEKAKVMIERRLAPVVKIAELVGYTNLGTFSMNFKEYFGDNTVLMQGYKVSGAITES